MSITRRTFISSSTAAAALMWTGVGRAAYLNLPIGLQLYSVRTLLPTDYAGTLKQLGALGYKEVEAAGFFNLPVEQVKAAMQAAGLRCVSAHYPLPLLEQHLDEILPFCKSLGVGFVVCSSPMHQQPGAALVRAEPKAAPSGNERRAGQGQQGADQHGQQRMTG